MRHTTWLLTAVLLLALAAAPAAAAQATDPGVTQEVLARGTVEYAAAVDGPATVYIGSVELAPGSRYGDWHTHPGPVWVVVTSGELALYGPDGCRGSYPAGAAYLAEPNTLYDLRNETTEPLRLYFSGIIPAGQPPTLPASPPAECPG